MIELGAVEDDQIVDWDNLFDGISSDLNFDFLDDPPAAAAADNRFSISPDSGCSLSIEDIEQYLLDDNQFNSQEEKEQNVLADEFFSDVLVDSPPASGLGSDRSASPDSVENEIPEKEKEEDKPQENGEDVTQGNENNAVSDVGDDSDPLAKKRKRQLRNRDAAVRSRERKKMYVRDLELKSKYYEAECRRLGMLLHSCLAENQALRLSLHNSKAFDASMTKQESAVLWLESLLLGSLLWFLGIICLLILPSQLLSTLELGLLEKAGSEEWERRAPKREESEIWTITQSFMISKRCRAARSRMKLHLSTVVVII